MFVFNVIMHPNMAADMTSYKEGPVEALEMVYQLTDNDSNGALGWTLSYI